MKIVTIPLTQMTIEQFADANDLTMEVRERAVPIDSPIRYYAHFQHAELKEGSMLCSASGDGPTPEVAIANYAERISLKLLVVDAMLPTRREFQLPRFVPAAQ